MPPPLPLLSLATLVDTARLRHTLNLCLFASSLFLFVGLGARQGWAEGTVRTDAAYTITPNEAVPCPSDSDLPLNTTFCKSSRSIVATLESRFNYGFFHDLVYRSMGTQEVTTSMYAHYDSDGSSSSSSSSDKSRRKIYGSKILSDSSSSSSSSSPPGTLIRTDIVIDPPIENTITQSSYSLWAQGNSAIIFIRAAQAFLLLAATALVAAWLLLFKGLYSPSSPPSSPARSPPPSLSLQQQQQQQQQHQQQQQPNLSGNDKAFASLKQGKLLVLFSALCVLLSLSSYTGGVSPHALTHLCVHAADAAALPSLPPLPPSYVTTAAAAATAAARSAAASAALPALPSLHLPAFPTPDTAFTTAAAAAATAAAGSAGIACTQLQSDPCNLLLLSLPPSLQLSAYRCESQVPTLTTHAGIWSLVFFAFLLLLFTGKVWGEVVGMIEGAAAAVTAAAVAAAEEEEWLGAPLLPPGGREGEEEARARIV